MYAPLSNAVIDPRIAQVQQCQNRAISACEVPKTPQVHAAQDRIDKAISGLHEIIANLEARLHPVLRQEPASPCAPPQPQAPPSTLMDKMNQSADSVGLAAQRLNEIHRLLEL